MIFLVVAALFCQASGAGVSLSGKFISFQGNEYYFSSSAETLDFFQADQFCSDYWDASSHLASIHSKEENSFINSQKISMKMGNTWIGAIRDLSDSALKVKPYSWAWADQTPFDVFALYTGCVSGVDCLWGASKMDPRRDEPNNFGGTEYCVSMAGLSSNPGAWRDDSCHDRFRFVCKKFTASSNNGAQAAGVAPVPAIQVSTVNNKSVTTPSTPSCPPGYSKLASSCIPELCINGKTFASQSPCGCQTSCLACEFSPVSTGRCTLCAFGTYLNQSGACAATCSQSDGFFATTSSVSLNSPGSGITGQLCLPAVYGTLPTTPNDFAAQNTPQDSATDSASSKSLVAGVTVLGVILALVVILVVRMKHRQSVQLAEQKPSVAQATPEPKKQAAAQELEIQQDSPVTSTPSAPQAWTVSADRTQEVARPDFVLEFAEEQSEPDVLQGAGTSSEC